jgi:hypothetical protein
MELKEYTPAKIELILRKCPGYQLIRFLLINIKILKVLKKSHK